MELPDSIDWPERTRQWWAAWVESPHTQAWTPLQWEYLMDTALLHATVWAGDVAKAAELRTRVERMGGIPLKGAPAAPVAAAAATEPVKAVTPLDELAQRRSDRSAGA